MNAAKESLSAEETLKQTPLSDGDCYEWPVVWKQELEGLRAELRYEEYNAEFADPRDADNLGIMVCWHPDYILGDEQIKNYDGRGAVKNQHDHSGRFRSIGALARWARTMEQAPVVLPLYLLDHSGISISAGSNAVGRGDTASGGRDEFGNARGWDTTLCGVIYTTPARILELCGEPQIETDRFYCPRTWPEDGRSGPNWPADRTAEQWLAKQLADEVQLYDRYLQGEVFYYCVEEIETGDILDSCGGYLPDVGEPHDKELDYPKSEARDMLASHVEERRKERAERAEVNGRKRALLERAAGTLRELGGDDNYDMADAVEDAAGELEEA